MADDTRVRRISEAFRYCTLMLGLGTGIGGVIGIAIGGHGPTGRWYGLATYLVLGAASLYGLYYRARWRVAEYMRDRLQRAE